MKPLFSFFGTVRQLKARLNIIELREQMKATVRELFAINDITDIKV